MIRHAASVFAVATAVLLTFHLHAQERHEATLSGHCRYSEQVLRHRADTTLIQCDAATLDRQGSGATLEFRETNWGPTAKFYGDMPGDEMTVRRVMLRDRRELAATGTCKLMRREDTITTISCLAKAGSRWVAANFVPAGFQVMPIGESRSPR